MRALYMPRAASHVSALHHHHITQDEARALCEATVSSTVSLHVENNAFEFLFIICDFKCLTQSLERLFHCLGYVAYAVKPLLVAAQVSFTQRPGFEH